MLETLIGYVVVYAVIFRFGMRYIYVLLREGSNAVSAEPAAATRGMAVAAFDQPAGRR